MLFVALGKRKPATTVQATIARRLEWQASEGEGQTVAEYWLQTPDPSVIVVVEADHWSQLASFAAWSDLFDISIYPAITGEEGLELVKQMPPP